MTLTGIDVSHHQGTIDWAKVTAAGHRFAFVKATEGVSFRDPRYASNVTGAAKAGLLVGAYHFARPISADVGNARRQAAHHAKVVGSLTGRLPSVLDIEGGLGDQTAWAFAFLDELERLTGKKPIIYTYGAHWNAHLRPDVAFARHPLWLARYNDTPGPPPRPWARWTFWQFTSSGTVPGIGGRVDLNHFDGDADDLAALAGATPAPTTPEEAMATGQFVGVVMDPDGKQDNKGRWPFWALKRDGGVYAFNGAPYLGGPLDDPRNAGKTWIGFAPHPTGRGYVAVPEEISGATCSTFAYPVSA